MSDQHRGLPVAGYRPQNATNVALVNEHEAMDIYHCASVDDFASFFWAPRDYSFSPNL